MATDVDLDVDDHDVGVDLTGNAEGVRLPVVVIPQIFLLFGNIQSSHLGRRELYSHEYKYFWVIFGINCSYFSETFTN